MINIRFKETVHGVISKLGVHTDDQKKNERLVVPVSPGLFDKKSE
jgi:hypothetical protein